MNKFEITCGGKRLSVDRDMLGNLYAVLPKRVSENGNEFFETISRDENAWRFTSSIIGDTEHYLSVWLNDDGTMAYCNDLSKGKITSENHFNPNAKKDGSLNDICKIIDLIKKQIEGTEKIGDDPKKIVDFRRKRLETTLRLLGYSNGKVDDGLSYLVLGMIGKQLEEYVNLAAYVQSDGETNGVENFKLNIPDNMSREEFLEELRKSSIELKDDFKFIEAQDEQTAVQRSLVGDYCLDMSKKIPPEDWKLYSKIVEEIAKLYMGLNADILPYSLRTKVVNATTLTGNDLKDRIAKLIDSTEFSKACNIEDRFVISETERFSQALDEMLSESDRVKHSSVGTALEGLKREAMSTRERRKKFVSRYDEIQKIYYSKKNTFGENPRKGVTQGDN